jgi:hypothetical protein
MTSIFDAGTPTNRINSFAVNRELQMTASALRLTAASSTLA